MKNFATLLLLTFLTTSIFAQTSQKEYDFLTNEYAALTAKGLMPELEGYYLEDLLELADKSGKVKLLYKNDQESIEPIAIQILLYDGDRTFYICVPSEKTSKDLYARYTDDIQSVFKISSNAQSIFSLIMVRYPIEIQRYYDEIEALEKAYAMEAVAEEKGANVVAPAKVEISKNTSGVVVKNYGENTDKGSDVALGKLAQSVGGGLKKRAVLSMPELINETGKSGIIRLNICVDGSGKLVRSTLQTDRSSSKDADLIAAAEVFVKQYRFENSASSRQCGYVIFEFQ